MTWFKNLIGGFKWTKTNYGIENKQTKKLIIKNGATTGDIYMSSIGEKIILNRNKNLEIISFANIKDVAKEMIQDVDHIDQIKQFIESGANGTTEMAIFVRDLLPNIFEAKTHAKRQKIIDSLNIIMESNNFEKYVLRWCWILRKIKNNSLHGEKIKEWFLENRKNENSFCNRVSGARPYVSTYTLNKYGMSPISLKSIKDHITYIDFDFDKHGPISHNFKNKKEFFEFYPQLKISHNSIYQYERVLSGPLEIAAEALVRQLGIKINE